MHRGLLVTLLVALLSFAGSTFAATPAADAAIVLAGKVTRVIDGDTIEVLLASGSIRVRLHAVDAPEHDQPGGIEAAAWLRKQLQDQQVLLEPISQDQYDRMVAIVHMPDRTINRDVVQAGWAWAYRRYMRLIDTELCELEAQARRARSGLWAGRASHAPWEFRATDGKGPFKDYGMNTASECRKAIGKR